MGRPVKIIRPIVPTVDAAELRALYKIAYAQAIGYSPSMDLRITNRLDRKRLLAPFDPTYRWRLGWHLSILGMDVLEANGVNIDAYRERTANMIRAP